MERALDLGLLTGALDETANLPAPEELRQLLADAEVASFFAGEEPLPRSLMDTAWNLHHVGTVRPALQLYGAARQIQANLVAAHIFDLALRTVDSPGEQLVFTFAAQVSSIRGDRTPNAVALGRRLPPPTANPVHEPGRASLELACALLTMNRRATLDLLRILRPPLGVTAGGATTQTAQSGLEAAGGVVSGCTLLQRYLTNGDGGDLAGAQTAFQAAATSLPAARDLDSRWVAAHLLDLCDDLGRSSVWAVLPTGTPPIVGKAMAFGDPPVMTLWPPQIELLTDPEQNPLRAEVKRSVMTFPTSAGKTLLTQLVIANHLATEQSGVCVVAPSHSLCREIREGLDRRLWVLRKHAVDEGPLGDPGHQHAPVVVMTPEKLAARLRSDEESLLAEFGLFVLDEAHLVADDTRGWTFETTISRLHQLTKGEPHRIVLVSAALGGTTSVQAWIDSDAASSSSVAKWRGPRRLHATYKPTLDHSTRRKVDPTGRQRVARTITDLKGVVRLFVDDGPSVATRTTPLGQEVETPKGKPTRPPVAAQLRPVVELAAKSGAVLAVHATKRTAEALAAQIASERDETDSSAALVRLAEQRMGPSHPLVAVLRKGVAYHHAALPVDIQVEIENAIRAGAIDIICSTTTLTEGVNLPVRTVVICERGFYDGEDFVQLIGPADLLNAAGRAGRAGRETEGWIVIVDQAGGPSARNALLELETDQEIRSTLVTTEAVQALAEYESVLDDSAALVLVDVPSEVDGFMAYCWYLADASALLDPTARAAAVIEGVRETLAWQQMSQGLRDRWEALSGHVAKYYETMDPLRRRRWARSGARLSANAVLESVVSSLATAAASLEAHERVVPLPVARVLIADGRLEELLALVSARDYRFKKKQYGKTVLVEVDLEALVLDWVAGVELQELADRHLHEVDDEAFRFEQLSTFLARVCEHHLPWVAGTLLDWLRTDFGLELCQNLPAFIHYGVADGVSLQLMTSGVRSRRIATVVGVHAAADGIEPGVARWWLSGLTPATWRDRFGAGTAEVSDLLQFSRDPAATTSAQLLDGQGVDVAVIMEPGVREPNEEWSVQYAVTDEHPRPLVLVRQNGDIAAHVTPEAHHDLAVLLDAGFRLLVTHRPDQPNATVRLVED